MNATTLKIEVGQLLSWAEHAQDYGNFEKFNKDIAPLDSHLCTVSQAEALYHYACNNRYTEESLCIYDYSQDDLVMIWMGEDTVMGIGTFLEEAAQDFLKTVALWYAIPKNQQ
jgi:hypothetical protein